MTKASKLYRVWVKQVNQTCFDVEATDVDDAIAKAERKWRREYFVPSISNVKQIVQEDRHDEG